MKRTRKQAPKPGTSPRPVPLDPDAPAAQGSGLFGLPHAPEDAEVVVIPVPWDATTSYGAGTAKGPAAILRASHQVDLLDREYGAIHAGGIAMLPIPGALVRLNTRARRAALPVLRAGGVPRGARRLEQAARLVNGCSDELNRWVSAEAARWLDRGKLVGVLGGDHSSPFGLMAELGARHDPLGVLHFDAHADLRDSYEGFTFSHASIFYEVLGRVPSVRRLVQVGIRDFGRGELALVEASGGRVRTHFDADVSRELAAGGTWDAIAERLVSELPHHVHVSFDVDALDPSLCPHTGTPVPGGLSWHAACHLLRVLSASGRRVVGFDLCEVAPGPRGDEWDANVGARLLYKLIGCALASRRLVGAVAGRS